MEKETIAVIIMPVLFFILLLIRTPIVFAIGFYGGDQFTWDFRPNGIIIYDKRY